MTEQHAQAGNTDSFANQNQPAGECNIPPVVPKTKKKASWTRTILWMLSMIFLVNVFFVILAWILYHYKVI